MSGFAEGTPTVTIQLGGKAYTLGWTWGAKRRVKDHLKPDDPFEENIAVILWASMDKEAREAISVEEIEELVHPENEAEVVGKFAELFKKSEPEPDPNADPVAVKEPTTGNQNSKNSGRLASTISV